jgi:hypothetical protein
MSKLVRNLTSLVFQKFPFHSFVRWNSVIFLCIYLGHTSAIKNVLVSKYEEAVFAAEV